MTNIIGLSYNENREDPRPVAYPCASCGDTWKRGPLLDTGGARYLINGDTWLCCACMVCSLVCHYGVKL